MWGLGGLAGSSVRSDIPVHALYSQPFATEKSSPLAPLVQISMVDLYSLRKKSSPVGSDFHVIVSLPLVNISGFLLELRING